VKMKSSELFNVAGYGVIVTGGASGIGLGYAEALAANGARVTLLDVDGASIEAETRRLAAQGWQVRGEVVDVCDHAALERAFDAAVAAHGRLDVVFANAGIDSGPGFVGSWVGTQRPRNPEGALERYSDERWNRVIEINLNGIFATLRAGARIMRPQRSGRMIVTTSVAAYQCEPVIGSAYMADRTRLFRDQHRWRSCQESEPAGSGFQGGTDAPCRFSRGHGGAGLVPGLTGFRLPDRTADLDRWGMVGRCG
jgi:NAD(P)-dependent dehydrogenase (short-subunit alcohol dehydrogenase family)